MFYLCTLISNRFGSVMVSRNVEIIVVAVVEYSVTVFTFADDVSTQLLFFLAVEDNVIKVSVFILKFY